MAPCGSPGLRGWLVREILHTIGAESRERRFFVDLLLGRSLYLLARGTRRFGIGVDGSWGQMIDGARDELSRDPIIGWNIGAAGGALFGLILAVNTVGDAIRDVLDPRTLRDS